MQSANSIRWSVCVYIKEPPLTVLDCHRVIDTNTQTNPTQYTNLHKRETVGTILHRDANIN